MTQQEIATWPAASVEDELSIRQIVDQLFIYTDLKEWARARSLFVDGPIEVDTSSLSGEPALQMTADQLLGGFAVGLHEEKASHHLATNYYITVNQDQAEVWANGYSWNRLINYRNGSDLWETWGNYRFSLQRTSAGWRLSAFRYFAKYNRGNDFVRTHTR